MAPELPTLEPEARPTPRSRLRRRRRSWPQRLLLGLGGVLAVGALVVAAVVGWGAWKLRSIDRADVVLDQRATEGPANYLIVGSDSRRGGDPLDPSAPDSHAPLADTIMLVRIDPGAGEARILSLPRDLWVTLSGSGDKGRINAAYAKGPQALIDTLRAELDVPINHYIEVDFHGFQELVTAVDGVPMWFDRAMQDRNTGLEVLHPGCVTLDGRAALAFARSRHLQYFEDGGFTYDGTGDLGRISRQQLFLRRVIDRVMDTGITSPLTLKRLVDVGTANVTIDDELSVGDLLALGQEYSSFESEQLETYTLPNTPRTTAGGAQVVELAADDAEPVLDLFREADRSADGTTPSAAAGAEAALLPPDSVTTMVLNSSGRSGLAVDAADALVAAGFDVDHFGNGSELGRDDEAATMVRYAPGESAQARTVAAYVEGEPAVVEDASLDEGEVVVFLGADFAGVRAIPAAGATPTTEAATTSTAVTTTTEVAEADVVGMVPADPPAGRSCG